MTQTYVETKCIACGTFHELKLDQANIHKIGQPYGICSACVSAGNGSPYYDGDYDPGF